MTWLLLANRQRSFICPSNIYVAVVINIPFHVSILRYIQTLASSVTSFALIFVSSLVMPDLPIYAQLSWSCCAYTSFRESSSRERSTLFIFTAKPVLQSVSFVLQVFCILDFSPTTSVQQAMIQAEYYYLDFFVFFSIFYSMFLH